MPSRRPRVVFLGLDVAGYGGIQVMCRHMLCSLEPICDLEALSLHDPPHTAFTMGSTTATLRGYEGSRAGFGLAALRASRGADLVFIAHPNIAPLVPFVGPKRTAILIYGNDGWVPLSTARRNGMRKARAIGAISQHTLDRSIAAQQLDPTHLFLLRPALEPRLVPRLPRNDGGPPMLLTVSRLDAEYRYKRIDEVIHAVPLIKEAVPDFVYTVVGKGSDLERLTRVAHDLGVADTVRFTGYVSDEELAGLYASASASIMLSAEEGFGLVFIEAMAWGVPVIAAAEGASVETLEEGRSGVLIDSYDPQTIADAVIPLLTDQTRRTDLIAAGHRRAGDFTYERFAQRVEELIGELVPIRTIPTPTA